MERCSWEATLDLKFTWKSSCNKFQRKFTLSLLLSSDFSPVAQFCSEDSCVANSY